MFLFHVAIVDAITSGYRHSEYLICSSIQEARILATRRYTVFGETVGNIRPASVDEYSDFYNI